VSDVWRIIYRYSKTEAWRLRYCAGCAYLESAQGVQGNCGYLLQVGHSRGCRPGKGCKRKKLISGWKWKLRGTYEEYLNGPPPDGWTPHGIREREQMKAWRIHRWAGSGRRTRWDVEYGEQLYREGWSYADIGRVVGIRGTNIGYYAKMHFWPEKTKTAAHQRPRSPEEIEAARAEHAKRLQDKTK
jgi:hypothetical protein